VNPAFRGAEGLENATDRHGNPMFMPDAVAWKRNLDFPDLFTTNPMLMERKIGLEPEAFTDFHFARPTGSHAGQ